MEIDGIGKISEQINAFDKVNKREKPTNKVKNEDKVEISSEAKEKLRHKQEMELLKLLNEESSELREEKIQEVRERIKEGYYDKESVKKEAINNLLNFFLP